MNVFGTNISLKKSDLQKFKSIQRQIKSEKLNEQFVNGVNIKQCTRIIIHDKITLITSGFRSGFHVSASHDHSGTAFREISGRFFADSCKTKTNQTKTLPN